MYCGIIYHITKRVKTVNVAWEIIPANSIVIFYSLPHIMLLLVFVNSNNALNKLNWHNYEKQKLLALFIKEFSLNIENIK